MKIKVLLFCFMYSLQGLCQTPSIKEVRTIAANLAGSYGQKIDTNIVEFKNKEGFGTVYGVNFNKKGFVLISSNKNMTPVLAYSLKGKLNENPDNPAFAEMLKLYNDITLQVDTSKAIRVEYQKKWKQMLSGAIPQQKRGSVVAPLITTTWNQTGYYNDSCPVCSPTAYDKEVVTGCVATAMAQVMRYHGWPKQGKGSHTNVTADFGSQYANFGTTNYNWNNMPDDVTTANSDVAQLMSHCGIAANMMYGCGGSGAYMQSATYALKQYFGYSKYASLVNIYGLPEAERQGFLEKELVAKRPLLMSGGRHAYVVDGVDNQGLFHVNWGWGGHCDGYFAITDFTPGGRSYPPTNAIMNLAPDTCQFLLSKAVPIKCGDVVKANSGSGTSNFYRYTDDMIDWLTPDLFSNEQVYSIDFLTSGKAQVSISDKSNRFRLYMYNAKWPDSLLYSGDTVITIEKATPGSYFIVVDKPETRPVDYSLKVVCPSNKPDIDIVAASLDKTVVLTTDKIVVNITVKNTSAYPAAGKYTINWYLSSDQVFDNTDPLMDNQDVYYMQPGESLTIKKTLNIPNGYAGINCSVFVVANGDNQLDEFSKSYNQVSLPVSIYSDVLCSDIIIQPGQWISDNLNTTPATYYIKDSLGKWTPHVASGDTCTGSGKGTEGCYSIDHSYYCANGPENTYRVWVPNSGIIRIELKNDQINSIGTLHKCIFLGVGCNSRLMIATTGAEEGKRNENTYQLLEHWVEGGRYYYIIIDSYLMYNSQYSSPMFHCKNSGFQMRVTLPQPCVSPKIEIKGPISFCSTTSTRLFCSATSTEYQWFCNGFPIKNASNNAFEANISGKYFVKCKCESGAYINSDTVTLTVTDMPSQPLITHGNIVGLFSGDSVRLKSSVLGKSSLQWFKDGNAITGKTSDSLWVKEQGLYHVSQTYFDCGVSSNTLPLSFKDLEKQTLNLDGGWNLVALGVIPRDSSVRAVFKSILPSVIEIKGLDEFFQPTLADDINSLKWICQQKAYMVRLKQPESLTIQGFLMEQLPGIQLKKGWNMVGFSISSPLDASSVFLGKPVERAKTLKEYWIPNANCNLIKLEPGKGYYINVTSNTYLKY